MNIARRRGSWHAGAGGPERSTGPAERSGGRGRRGPKGGHEEEGDGHPEGVDREQRRSPKGLPGGSGDGQNHTIPPAVRLPDPELHSRCPPGSRTFENSSRTVKMLRLPRHNCILSKKIGAPYKGVYTHAGCGVDDRVGRARSDGLALPANDSFAGFPGLALCCL